MSNETIVKNGPVGAAGEKNHNPARALVGKIARLPKDIREALNCRLDDGQPASEILPWVNGLPAAIEVLAKYFGGAPITDGNLSEWRRKGYQRWLERQEAAAELKELVEDMEDFSNAAGGKVARIAVAKILRLLHAIPAEQASVNDLTKISHAVSALLNADQNQARLEYEKTRVFQGNERLVLSWDKHLRGCVASAQRALKDAICKDIEAANIDNSEKIELMGHHMFGKKWQGRKVGKKQAPKQEPGELKKESPESAEMKKAEGQQGHEPLAGSPPHPQSLSPDGGEGDGSPDRETSKDSKHEASGNAEQKKAKGQTADQQVRPTTAQSHSTEAAVSPVREKAEVKEADTHIPAEIKGSKAKPEETAEEKTGMNITGSLTTAATSPAVPPNPEQKPPAQEAQLAPIKNTQPKPQENPMVPKPSPWDAFSEPVTPSPFAPFYGMMRPESWKNKLG